MDPNQQPNQTPPQPPVQPAAPQPLTGYDTPQPLAYDPNYLDSIAPPPPRPSFFSGSFGKIFFAMIGVFVLAVSLIIAFSGNDNTADLQQLAVRLNNLSLTAKKVQPNLKSNNLSTANSTFQVWITDSQHQSVTLLQEAGVKKSQYDKTMVASEKTLSDNLNAKFDDARLNAVLDRVYASTMSSETEKFIVLFTAMGKNSKAKAIRDYANSTSANLALIHKSFNSYVDDGN